MTMDAFSQRLKDSMSEYFDKEVASAAESLKSGSHRKRLMAADGDNGSSATAAGAEDKENGNINVNSKSKVRMLLKVS